MARKYTRKEKENERALPWIIRYAKPCSAVIQGLLDDLVFFGVLD
jgi:hypothetical protein